MQRSKLILSLIVVALSISAAPYATLNGEPIEKKQEISTLKNNYSKAIKGIQRIIKKKYTPQQKREIARVVIGLLVLVTGYGMYKWYRPSIKGTVPLPQHRDDQQRIKIEAQRLNQMLQTALKQIQKQYPNIEDAELVNDRMSELEKHLTAEEWDKAIEAIRFAQNQIIFFLRIQTEWPYTRILKWLNSHRIQLPWEITPGSPTALARERSKSKF